MSHPPWNGWFDIYVFFFISFYDNQLNAIISGQMNTQKKRFFFSLSNQYSIRLYFFSHIKYYFVSPVLIHRELVFHEWMHQTTCDTSAEFWDRQSQSKILYYENGKCCCLQFRMIIITFFFFLIWNIHKLTWIWNVVYRFLLELDWTECIFRYFS